MQRLKQDGALMLFGGISYGLIEILWRRYTHWSMIITGGLCFLLLFRIYTHFKKLTLFMKCIIGAGVITSIEFIVGCIVNLWLKLDVWDYSSLTFNVFGQICPLYSFLWGVLSIPIAYLCNMFGRKFKIITKKETA